MKYDFTTIMDRHGRDAIAVDSVGKIPGFAPEAPAEGFDLIPMWVADMNFPTAPSITEALHKRIDHPAFGYFSPTDEYYNAIIRWQTTRNGVKGLTKECIGYENGVLGGLVSASRAPPATTSSSTHRPTSASPTPSATTAGTSSTRPSSPTKTASPAWTTTTWKKS